MLRYGHPAPPFSLPSTSGRDIALSDFKGNADVVVLATSGDSSFSHAEFHRRHQLPFALLSDVHWTAIRTYDVWDEDRNVAYRSTFIVAVRSSASST